MSDGAVGELGRWLEVLARKWERFFAHDPKVRTPPERERAALERRLRDLSREEGRPAAEEFQVQQLLHRFTTYSAMWQRLLREREGERLGKLGAAPPAAPAPETPAAAPLNASGRAPVREADGGLARLHQTYVAALRAAGGTGAVSLERFAQLVETQRQRLAERGAVVEGFDVVNEGAGVKLRARVRRGREK